MDHLGDNVDDGPVTSGPDLRPSSERNPAMTIIRVNPSSVQSYGADAQEKFDTIRVELVKLVDECAEVRYFGQNAVQFKTQCGQLAADLATQLVQKMGAIADVIKTATSNIAASLGGTPIVISVTGGTVGVPAVPSVDYVDVDTSALEALIPQVTGSFTRINGLFDEHLSKLVATDWEGNAKQEAVSTVQSFTGAAKAAAAESQQKITVYVRSQIESVLQADKT
jgi:hypothetical protein